MRNGRVYLKDYDDYLDVHRAEDSGLKVINVSQFSNDSGALPLTAFVPDVLERCKEKNLICKVDSPASSSTRSSSPGFAPDKT
eukprot:1452012-Karenia_brevis.AAC.1